eukprot:5662707-Prymnesium_polylepis.1
MQPVSLWSSSALWKLQLDRASTDSMRCVYSEPTIAAPPPSTSTSCPCPKRSIRAAICSSERPQSGAHHAIASRRASSGASDSRALRTRSLSVLAGS